MTSTLYSTSELSYNSVPLSSSSSSSSTSQPRLRADGRSPLSYRDIILNTSISNAQGSIGSASASIVDLNGGETRIVAAVRAEIGNLRSDDDVVVEPQQKKGESNAAGGSIFVTIECSPTALPSLPSTTLPTLSSLLPTLFSSTCLPRSFLSQLIVIPNSKAWNLHLDILIESSLAGNVIDLVLVASRSALASLRLPSTKPISFTENDEMDEETGGEGQKGVDVGFSGLVKGGKRGEKVLDFELMDDHGEGGKRLDRWEDLPVGITLNLIDQVPFLDATALEEQASQSAITVAFDSKGDIVATRTFGDHGEIEVARIIPLIRKAQGLAADFRKALNQKLIDA